MTNHHQPGGQLGVLLGLEAILLPGVRCQLSLSPSTSPSYWEYGELACIFMWWGAMGPGRMTKTLKQMDLTHMRLT